MIQRAIIRQSRLASVSARPSIRPFLRPIQQSHRAALLSSPLRISSKWYSSAATLDSDALGGESGKAEEVKTEGAPEDSLKVELAAKEREIIDLKDKYLRSVADFRNLQERTKREVQSAKDFAIQRFAKDLVESIDNLDRALETVPAEKLQTPPNASEPVVAAHQDLKSLHDGLKMTETILMQTLKKHGLERFDPSEAGEKFDPNLHEATFSTPVEGKEDGTVFHTMQKGFLLNGRVLRAAKVGIVKHS